MADRGVSIFFLTRVWSREIRRGPGRAAIGHSQMNFLIDAESKRPSSGDPNPKGGNDPERAGNRPSVVSVCSPFLFLLFSSSFLFFFCFRLQMAAALWISTPPCLSCAWPMETGPLSLRTRVPTSPRWTRRRSTCNLLYSILPSRPLPAIRTPKKCVQGRRLIRNPFSPDSPSFPEFRACPDRDRPRFDGW